MGARAPSVAAVGRLGGLCGCRGLLVLQLHPASPRRARRASCTCRSSCSAARPLSRRARRDRRSATCRGGFHTFRITDEAIEQRKGVALPSAAPGSARPAAGGGRGAAAAWDGSSASPRSPSRWLGGASRGSHLQFLRLADAEALRNEILALAAGFRADVAAARRVRRRSASRGNSACATRPNRSGSLPLPARRATSIAAAAERPLVAVPVPRLLVVDPVVVGNHHRRDHDASSSWRSRSSWGCWCPTSTSSAHSLAAASSACCRARRAWCRRRLRPSTAGSTSAWASRGTACASPTACWRRRKQTVPPGRVQAVHFQAVAVVASARLVASGHQRGRLPGQPAGSVDADARGNHPRGAHGAVGGHARPG